MNKTCMGALLLVVAGCSEKSEECHDACCAKPSGPAASVVLRDLSRADGILLTGLPESGDLAACDSRGRWGVKTAVFEHSLEDPKEKAPLLPEESKPRITLYRDSLPFPQVNWKSGDWEVTQLLFPFGKGYVARYHVMNHGEDPREGHLKVGLRNPAPDSSSATIASAGKPAASSLQFDFKCDPGVSQFFFVTTPDLAGAVPEDALDQATAQWEKLIGKRALKVPDEVAAREYYGNLAGSILGVKGCAEAVAKTELQFAKAEGKSLRLLGGIPEKWTLEAIEVSEFPTEFGPLSFKYQGAYNNRTFELGPGCAPPEGFLIPVPEKLNARIDGKEAPATGGAIKVPAGAKFVEVSYPR
ncbi:MAG TPA: hypothetical protein VKU80_10175 [Planctomycetota bacterium]|nr:hypothetical protein [Planctomycetota bacterium]